MLSFQKPRSLTSFILNFRSLVVLACLFIVVLLAAGCDGQGQDQIRQSLDQQQPIKGGTLTFQIAEPAYIDPYNVQESEGIQVAANVFDGLVTFDPVTSRILPAVAGDWSANKTNTIWTFNLREKTKFHNGREVTAEDFVYAFNRIADPTLSDPSVVSYHLDAIKGFSEVQEGKAETLSGLRAKDKYTLEIELSYPFASFIYILGHPALVPVPKEEVEKDPKAFAQKPIGNGPFKMAEPWKHDQEIKVEKFNDYYLKIPFVDSVLFKIYQDEQTAYLDFQAGDLDFNSLIPTGQVVSAIKKYGSADYIAKKGNGVLFGEESSLYYLNINNEFPPLMDKRIRQAISFAIDRKAIADDILEGGKWPAGSIIPPGTIGYEPGENNFITDKAKASELLKAAGFPGGKGLPTIELAFNAGGGHEEIMQVVQSDLKAVGINVELKSMDFGTLLDEVAAGKHQIAREAWFLDYPIPDNILYSLFHSGSIGGSNASRYNDPEVDAELGAARNQPTLNESIDGYAMVEKMVIDDMPIVPLFFYRHQAVVAPRVNGFVFSPLGIAPLENVWFSSSADVD